MTRHYAYGLDITDLDVVVVDDSKPMQTILRSTLLGFRVRRVRTFDSAEEALEVMRIDPPNMVITDWRMKPTSGVGLLRSIRQRKMAPLCFLPVVFVTAHGTRTLIDRILRDGAQNVIIKPLSPSALFERLNWTLRDSRPLVLGENGRYVVDGVAESLDEKARKWQQIGGGRSIVAVSPARAAVSHQRSPAPLEDLRLPKEAIISDTAARTAERGADNTEHAKGEKTGFAKIARVRRANSVA
ncbi:response regulator [Stappia sp. ES.058]|uniref:response regulator n=1 Tax=Stappia sp. ES.058 TaxID=1881061 RepID=UPI001FCD4532|nr:response regulator [Stappia sp. ES.058]